MVQGLIYDVPATQVLIERIIAEAETIIRCRLGAMLGFEDANCSEAK